MYRSSSSEWSGLGAVMLKKSANTVTASSKETLCLRRFAAAFAGAHSNSVAFSVPLERLLTAKLRDR
jgi:hypothetical protein